MSRNKVEHSCSACYFIEYKEDGYIRRTSYRYKSIADFEKFIAKNNISNKVTDYRLIKEVTNV